MSEVREKPSGVLRVAFLGDVVGRPGRTVLKELVRPLRVQYALDLVVANGENSSGGAGIDAGTATEIQGAGVDLITLGDHAFQRKGVGDFLEKNSSWCIRPYNHPPGTPGKGVCRWTTPSGVSVIVMNLIGRVFIGGPQSCPFRGFDAALQDVGGGESSVVLCDMHAEATSEKWALGRYIDGRASLLVGTHTHVQTSDAQILPGGTGYLTDLGMCGSANGVIGMSAQVALKRFLSPTPAPYEVAEGNAKLSGVVADISLTTGRAEWIALLQEASASEKASQGKSLP
jgi:metallophosphoesterase (TIGR00282 family)